MGCIKSKSGKRVSKVAQFSILLGISSCIAIFFIQLLLHAVKMSPYVENLIGSILSGNQPSHFTEVLLQENELPVCVGNILDQQEYNRNVNQPRGSCDNNNRPRLMFKTGSCQLLHYTSGRVVTSLDALYNNQDHFIVDGSNYVKPTLHFAFMGDSRIRQQFFNFLKLIPDYDRKSQPNPIPVSYHGDIEITSKILRLQVSFKWWPLIDVNGTETLRQWAMSNKTEKPHLIFLSVSLWHIVRIHSINDFKIYEEKLTELASILYQLANFSEVVWLNQYPTAEFYEGMPYGGVNNSDILVTAKIQGYNEAIRRIFEKYSSSIRIWNSSNYLAEEYVRGCALFHRSHFGTPIFIDPDNTYINCDDYIHTGYSALSQASEQLLNAILNHFTQGNNKK